jgi:hypothetical protein
MNAFESALAEYRAALLAASSDLTTDTQRGLYQLHVQTIDDIERRYRETSNAYDCRLLIEGEGIIHESDVLKGPAVSKMKDAFSQLLTAVRQAYGR